MYQGSYGRIIVKEENGISLTPMRGEGFKTCYSGKGGGGTRAVQMVIFGEGPGAIKNARMVIV